jgi:hypothetical protein
VEFYESDGVLYGTAVVTDGTQFSSPIDNGYIKIYGSFSSVDAITFELAASNITITGGTPVIKKGSHMSFTKQQ